MNNKNDDKPSTEDLINASSWLIDHATTQIPPLVAKMLSKGESQRCSVSDIGHGMNLRVTLTMEEQDND